MADKSMDQELARLRAENEALRGAAASANPLHPAVEPGFFNGSVVLFDGKPHRVVGRSIDWDGVATYTVHPCEGHVAHVDTATQTFHHIPLDQPHARDSSLDPERTHGACRENYAVTLIPDAERVFEVPEADLEPFRPEDVSAGPSTRDYHVVSSSTKGDVASMNEGAAITRSEE